MKDLNLSLENLRHYQELCETQNIGLTAQKLHISPSAISFSLKKIEEEIGVELFDRIGKRIFLNHDGKKFLTQCSSVLGEFATLKHFKGKEKGLSGHYIIGGSHYLMSQIIPLACLDAIKANPALSFELRSMDTYSLNSEIQSGQLDFAFAFSPDAQKNIHKEIMYQGKLILAVGVNHPLTKLKFADWKKEIANYPYSSHKSGKLQEKCDEHPMFLQHDIHPKINIFWDNDESGLSILRHSSAWSLLPDVILNKTKSLAQLTLPKTWDAPYEIALLFHKSSKNHDLIHQFKDGVQKHL